MKQGHNEREKEYIQEIGSMRLIGNGNSFFTCAAVAHGGACWFPRMDFGFMRSPAFMPHTNKQVLATPGDNSIDHTVRAELSYPGP